MTIAERINLHRCGYTRAEIDALAREEKEEKAAEETSPDTAPAEETSPDTAPAEETSSDPVLEAIKGLTAAIQASNINRTPQPEVKQETVTDLLRNL